MTALIIPDDASVAQMADILTILEAQERLERRTRLYRYAPYAKQRDFHAAGATHRERLLMAGNQLGKTLAGAAEMAMHLTGLYIPTWEGRRFDRPIRAWAGSKDGKVTRDGVQKLLIGEPKDQAQWGEGLIPGGSLVDTTRYQGVADALDGALVKHVSGGNSVLSFKTYDAGREAWQSETLDVVWFDEEPPLEIYMEGLTRTNATGGIVYMTFTPLKGMSDVVHMFVTECGL